MTIQDGVRVVFGGDAAKLISAAAAGKLAIGGLVTFGVVKMAQFDRAARQTQRQWERSMTEIATLVEMPRHEIERMRKEMAGLSVAAGQVFKDVAKARYDTISAGFTDAADSAAVLEAAARGAVGGLTDIATSTKATISILNSYRMPAREAARVNDLLFATVQQGVTTYGELAANIGDVAATAAAAKVPLEDLLALIATVTRGGIGTAEAVTAINALLLSFIKRGPDAQRVAEAFGIDLDNMGDAMARLGTLAERDLELITRLVPSVRGLKAAVAGAAGQGTVFDQVRQAFDDPDGLAAEAARKMGDTLDMLAKRAEAAAERTGAAWGAIVAPVEEQILRQKIKLLGEFADILERISAQGGNAWNIAAALSLGAINPVAGMTMISSLQGKNGIRPSGGGIDFSDPNWLRSAMDGFEPKDLLRPIQQTGELGDAAERAARGLSDIEYQLGRYDLLMKDYGRVADVKDPGVGGARNRGFFKVGGRFGPPPLGTGFNLSGGGGMWPAGRGLSDEKFAGVWKEGQIRGLGPRDPLREAQQELQTVVRLADAVIGGLASTINQEIGGALASAFNAGESAIGRFAASALASIAQIIAEAIVLRGVLSMIGLGGLGDLLGLASFGLFDKGGYVPGYAWGGATGGAIDEHQVAGVVHAGEYVLSAEATSRIGRHNLDRANRDSGGNTTFQFGDIHVTGTSTQTAEDIARGVLFEALPQAMRKMNRTGAARLIHSFGSQR